MKNSYLIRQQERNLVREERKSKQQKKEKQINIRHFFVKNCYERGEFEIENGPTDNMTADYFTKPPQGKKFFKFIHLIMGE